MFEPLRCADTREILKFWNSEILTLRFAEMWKTENYDGFVFHTKTGEWATPIRIIAGHMMPRTCRCAIPTGRPRDGLRC